VPSPAESPLVATFRSRAETLPGWLHAHVARVVTESRRLAQIHEVDPQRLQAAAWGHDLYRHLDDDALRREAAGLGIEEDLAERAAPILLHGPIAAERASREWAVDDADVLEAIRFHTTGRPAMSDIALLLFLADKIEPEKLAADPGLTPVRDLADSHPDAAMLVFLERRITTHLASGLVVHPLAVETRNWYLGRVGEGS
jgi:predicted HD superfamily hydrolase involved in NAD metabolism